LDSITNKIERMARRISHYTRERQLRLHANPSVTLFLREDRYRRLKELMEETKVTIDLVDDPRLHREDFHMISVQTGEDLMRRVASPNRNGAQRPTPQSSSRRSSSASRESSDRASVSSSAGDERSGGRRRGGRGRGRRGGRSGEGRSDNSRRGSRSAAADDRRSEVSAASGRSNPEREAASESVALGNRDVRSLEGRDHGQPEIVGARPSGNNLENGTDLLRADNGAAAEENRASEARDREGRSRGRRRRGSRGRGRRGRPILEANPALSTSVSREGQQDEGSS